jgi:hypothetical protein
VADPVATARRAIRAALVAAALQICAVVASAHESAPCRFLCDQERKVEPTFTVENLVHRHRVMTADGTIARAKREKIIETVVRRRRSRVQEPSQ